MDLVQSFVAFARGSPKRLACFSSFKAPDGVSLRPFCPTRWILRKPSITSITSNYSEIIKWLEDFDSHPENRQQRAVAAGYLKTFYNFDTFWKLELLRIIFTMVEDSNTALQSAQLNFRKAENVIKTLKDVIGRLRSSERFELLWDSAVLAAKAKRIDEPVLPRKRKDAVYSHYTFSIFVVFTPFFHYLVSCAELIKRTSPSVSVSQRRKLTLVSRLHCIRFLQSSPRLFIYSDIYFHRVLIWVIESYFKGKEFGTVIMTPTFKYL